jgi:hypothetical protein
VLTREEMKLLGANKSERALKSNKTLRFRIFISFEAETGKTELHLEFIISLQENK